MMPDFSGYYDISSLVAGKYFVEISSFKDRSIVPTRVEINITYDALKNNAYELNTYISNHEIKVVK